MANTVIVKNSVTAGARPASGVPGELFVNVADKVLGTFDAAGAPVEVAKPAVPPPIDAYSDKRTYGVSELVTGGGSIFQCITAITTPEAWDGAKWKDMFAAAPTTAAGLSPYDASKTYNASDFVTMFGAIWQCTTNIATAEAWDYGHWRKVLPAPGAIIAHNAALTYTAGDYVTGSGALWQATIDISTPEAWDATHWRQVLPGPITVFETSKTYNTDDLVVNAGHIYRAKAAVAAAAFDATQWDEVGAASSGGGGGGASPITDFDATKPYKPNDLVVYNGHIYRANGALVAGAFHEVEWTNVSSGDGAIPAWSAVSSYKLNDLVVYKGKIYRATGTVPVNTLPTTPGKWTPIETSWAQVTQRPAIWALELTEIISSITFGERNAFSANIEQGGILCFTINGNGADVTVYIKNNPDYTFGTTSGTKQVITVPFHGPQSTRPPSGLTSSAVAELVIGTAGSPLGAGSSSGTIEGDTVYVYGVIPR